MADQDPLIDEDDPLLVRPYISSDPAASGTTWPAAAAQPARPVASHRADVTVPIAPAGAPPSRGHRRALVLAGAGAALVLALAGAGFAALRTGDDPAPVGALPADPVYTGSAPTSAPSATTTPAPPPTTGAAIIPAPVVTTTASRPPTSRPATTTPATSKPAAPTSPAATMSLVPAVDRVGTVVGAGGLCLDLNGGVPADDNHVQVFVCNGSNAQRWTLAADGTLRVAGKCAQVVADSTVHIIGCDNRPAAQWRAGPNRSLVNAGRCLTDPRAGAASGTGVLVATCTGGPGQQWSLP